jgi:hypothetical protein
MINGIRPLDQSKIVTISRIEYETLGDIIQELINSLEEEDTPGGDDNCINSIKLIDKGVSTIKNLTDIKSGITNTLNGTATKFWNLQEDGKVI